MAGVAGLAGLGAAQRGTRSAPSTGAAFEAGAARVDASPREEHLEEGVYLGGFGLGPQPSRRATGNHDGVSARALAASVGGEAFALAVLDVTGLGNVQQRAIRERVEERTGLDPENVLLHASHTHAGPDFQGLWGGVPESYRTFVVERTAEAIVEALASREPARAFAGSVDAQELAGNRRYDDDRGTVSSLTAVQFRASGGGGTVGTLVNFGAHPTIVGSGNSLVATDYVGPVERAVEAAHGGVALYVQSAIGDASARGVGGEDDYDRAGRYGRAVAARADDALADAGRVHARLAARSTSVRLPIDNCVFKAGFESGLFQPYYDGESVTGTVLDPAGEAAGEVSPELGTAVHGTPENGALAIHSPVARVALGGDRGRSVELLTVPGEAVTALGRDLVGVMADAGADESVLAGLTQNSLGYLVPKDRYEDGYEETVSLGPDTAPLYRNAVTALYDLDRPPYERLPPGPENVCPEGQAQFGSYASEFATRFDAGDGPMGVDP